MTKQLQLMFFALLIFVIFVVFVEKSNLKTGLVIKCLFSEDSVSRTTGRCMHHEGNQKQPLLSGGYFNCSFFLANIKF